MSCDKETIRKEDVVSDSDLEFDSLRLNAALPQTDDSLVSPILPREIIEKILFFCTGSTLAQARRVDKTFQSLVRHLTENHLIWKKICIQEIPAEFIINVIEKLYPYYSVKGEHIINWELVYKSWYQWRNIKKWLCQEMLLFELRGYQIKCVKLSGDWIIYGTYSEGIISAFNYVTDEAKRLYRGMGVRDICLSNTIDKQGDEVFPHNELSFQTINNDLFTSSINCYKITPRLLQYDPSNGDNYVIPRDAWLYYVHTKYCEKMRCVGLIKNLQECELLEKVSTNEIAKFYVRIYFDLAIELIPKHQLRDTDRYYEGKITISDWNQLHMNVLMGSCYFRFHMLIFFVKDNSKVYLVPMSLSRISTGVLHANMLFLANDLGFVFAYQLNSIDNLLSLDLEKYTWKQRLCEKYIVNIEVGETKDKPFLIFTTNTAIYKADFFR